MDLLLHRRGVRRLRAVSPAQFLGLAPRDSQDDVYLAAAVRSLADYLDGRGMLSRPAATLCARIVSAYRDHLQQVRGLANSTLRSHCTTAAELLAFVGCDRHPARLQHLRARGNLAGPLHSSLRAGETGRIVGFWK